MRDATVRRAARALEKLAERARQDPVAFLELAARSEHERERVVPAAHQRVLLDFVASHRRSVVRAFVGSGKTWTLAYLGIHLSGNNPTGRGAVIGASGSAAAQTLGLIRDVVEDARGEYPEVRLVFPGLRPSPNVSDPWGQRAITFDRPGGIRDPSWIAIGYGGALPGKRLRWIVGDDMLDEVNTATDEARNKFGQTYARKVLTRLDARDAMNVFLNTPWDPDDATFRLEKAGWPTLSMEVEGEVRVSNTEWSSPELRPSRLVPGAWRLAANDGPEWAPLCEVLPDGSRRRADPERPSGLPTEHFDLDEEVPLWPGTRERPKFDREAIASIREDFRADPGAFMAKYKLRPRVPADEQRKRAWVEECKLNARALGIRGCATGYRGPNLTTTGLDLATGAEDGSDWRALFTYETVPELRFQLRDGRWRHLHNARRVLSVRYGRWVGEELVRVVEQEVEAFDSTLRVETNGGADHLRQWLVARQGRPGARSFTITAHVTTAANKNARVSGIPGLFIVLENLAWIIPCDEEGRCPEDVQRWVDGLLAWRPELHPDDGVIASWLAHEQARSLLGDGFLGVDLASVEARFRG